MKLYEMPKGVNTRWFSFENTSGGRGAGALDNKGWKGRAFDKLLVGETKTVLDVKGSGEIRRMWFTTAHSLNPEVRRSLRIDIYWDGSDKPAVSCPFGDFFGIGLGGAAPFECQFFASPEGSSFNCFIPMPFRTSARVTITNEWTEILHHLFYEINVLLDVEHGEDMLYFHAHWRRESPTTLGKDFDILPKIRGRGRFLGCNLGVIPDPEYGTWWGEGEFKVWFGDDEHPTLCGTGTEDHIGSAWGQGLYAHRTQGCPLIYDVEPSAWAFYRYHIDDPIYFHEACRVAIQTIGGAGKEHIIGLIKKGLPLTPISIDPDDKTMPFTHLMDLEQPVNLERPEIPDGWCNYMTQDDWSGVAYFYLDAPESCLPPLQPIDIRTKAVTRQSYHTRLPAIVFDHLTKEEDR